MSIETAFVICLTGWVLSSWAALVVLAGRLARAEEEIHRLKNLFAPDPDEGGVDKADHH